MQYEKARELASASYQHWISEELFSFNWFVLIIVEIVVYIIWLKLLDKSKASQLLLLGSLAAVGYILSNIVLYNFYGFVEFKIALTPFEPPLFTVAATIAPVVIMIVQQYTSSWKSYILWTAIGMAFIAFVLPTHIFCYWDY